MHGVYALDIKVGVCVCHVRTEPEHPRTWVLKLYYELFLHDKCTTVVAFLKVKGFSHSKIIKKISNISDDTALAKTITSQTIKYTFQSASLLPVPVWEAE